MADDTPATIERRCDVAIIGGSAAGLAAALQLGRQRRSVIVVDAGEPRNAPAAHLHGYLGGEGLPPSHLITTGREEVRTYGGEILAGRASRVSRTGDDCFRVELVGGNCVVARRLLAATGLIDELPDIDGVAEHWGRDVIHCPFCHGYEFRDQRIVQIVSHPLGLHSTGLFRQLTDKLTVVLDDDVEVDTAEIDALRTGGVDVVVGKALGVIVNDDGRLAAVAVANGPPIGADAVVVGPRFGVRAELFEPLGLRATPHPSGLGDFIETDATGATAVRGLYAAGNVTDPSQQVLQAAADGARVGAMISFDLAHDDIRSGTRPGAQQADWDTRYSGAQLWSGNPNGTLVNEVTALAPGRALDVGAGEGGDALWLADQGWTVTASDISECALQRIQTEAQRRGLQIDCRHVDANAARAFGVDVFDLVSVQYPAIPRTPDDRGPRNIVRAVAPGGTLLVVGHDDALHDENGQHAHSRPFDTGAYVRVDDLAAELTESPEWDIVVRETRARPNGSATDAHHHSDVVLRARRRAT